MNKGATLVVVQGVGFEIADSLDEGGGITHQRQCPCCFLQAGVFGGAEIRFVERNKAVERPHPLEFLSRLVDRLMQPFRLFLEGGNGQLKLFDGNGTDFLAEGSSRPNSIRHERALASDVRSPAPGWNTGDRRSLHVPPNRG